MGRAGSGRAGRAETTGEEGCRRSRSRGSAHTAGTHLEALESPLAEVWGSCWRQVQRETPVSALRLPWPWNPQFSLGVTGSSTPRPTLQGNVGTLACCSFSLRAGAWPWAVMGAPYLGCLESWSEVGISRAGEGGLI